MTFLFLFSLCVLPFVVISSTFTSENPIELPSATSAKLVVDVNGKALDPRASYRIISTFWGALGGDVYLGRSPTTNRCPDGVFRYNSDVGPGGTPVRFITSGHFGPGIFEQQDINIQFSIKTSRLCVDYTIWKVGDYDASLGATLLETGGTIGQKDSSWFNIVKADLGYKLSYCPPNPCPPCPPSSFVCPCPPIGIVCQTVSQVFQNGKRRLALVNGPGLTWNFRKV